MHHIGYNEVKQRGTLDFPIEIYHISNSHPRYTMDFHWHIEYEIIRILEGEFLLTLNEEEYLLKKGDIFFIPGGALHAGQPSECIYECIVFDLGMLMKEDSICTMYLNQVADGEITIKNKYPETEEAIHTVVWNLFDALWSKKEGYPLLVTGLLTQFMGHIFAGGHYELNKDKASRNRKKIVQLKKALSFIETNYHMPLSLSQLSMSAGMSPKYFCRFFQEMTRRTPMDYLNYYRIESASQQLIATDLTITEIAFNSGFNDLSYFIRTFKRYKGITPKKYVTQAIKK